MIRPTSAGGGDVSYETLLDLPVANADSVTKITCVLEMFVGTMWIKSPSINGYGLIRLDTQTRFTLQKESSTYTMELTPGPYRISITLDSMNRPGLIVQATATISNADGAAVSTASVRNEQLGVPGLQTLSIPGLYIPRHGTYSLSVETQPIDTGTGSAIATSVYRFIFERGITS